jgi:hypothetical protein
MVRSKKFDASVGPACELVRYNETQLWMTSRSGRAQRKVEITREEYDVLEHWNVYGEALRAAKFYESKLAQ